MDHTELTGPTRTGWDRWMCWLGGDVDGFVPDVFRVRCHWIPMCTRTISTCHCLSAVCIIPCLTWSSSRPRGHTSQLARTARWPKQTRPPKTQMLNGPQCATTKSTMNPNRLFFSATLSVKLGPPQKVETPNVTKAGLANDAAPLSSLTGCNLASNLSKPTCFVWAAGVHVI